MTLQVEEFDNHWKRIMLSECPVCGHEFGKNQHRWKHYLEDHDPEDFGLSPLGVVPEDHDDPLFLPPEELPYPAESEEPTPAESADQEQSRPGGCVDD